MAPTILPNSIVRQPVSRHWLPIQSLRSGLRGPIMQQIVTPPAASTAGGRPCTCDRPCQWHERRRRFEEDQVQHGLRLANQCGKPTLSGRACKHTKPCPYHAASEEERCHSSVLKNAICRRRAAICRLCLAHCAASCISTNLTSPSICCSRFGIIAASAPTCRRSSRPSSRASA